MWWKQSTASAPSIQRLSRQDGEEGVMYMKYHTPALVPKMPRANSSLKGWRGFIASSHPSFPPPPLVLLPSHVSTNHGSDWNMPSATVPQLGYRPGSVIR